MTGGFSHARAPIDASDLLTEVDGRVGRPWILQARVSMAVHGQGIGVLPA